MAILKTTGKPVKPRSRVSARTSARTLRSDISLIGNPSTFGNKSKVVLGQQGLFQGQECKSFGPEWGINHEVYDDTDSSNTLPTVLTGSLKGSIVSGHKASRVRNVIWESGKNRKFRAPYTLLRFTLL